MDNFVEQQFSSSNTAYSRLLYTQTIGMSAAGMIALLALFGWLVPSFDQILPKEWWLMKPDTALCILLGAISILLIQKSISVLAVRLCGMMIIFLAALSLYGYATGQSLPVEALLATIYRISGQNAGALSGFFLLIGSFVYRCRENRRSSQQHS